MSRSGRKLLSWCKSPSSSEESWTDTMSYREMFIDCNVPMNASMTLTCLNGLLPTHAITGTSVSEHEACKTSWCKY